MTSHEMYMQMAIQNAKAMAGQTDPNPLVGSVIVKDGRIVGVGTHLRAGGPHAEVHALRMAGEEARGATAYVTLEPCSHHGRTGPCAVALVEAGVKKVVVATLDPNPIVAGNGIRILQEAGIEVEVGVCEQEAREMNEVFNKFIVTKRPFITMKAASTLDGKIATKTGSSQWITSAEAREDVHVLRHQHAAILVGSGTVLADDPQLTTRLPKVEGLHPVRIVLDSHLSLPLTMKLFNDGLAPTWVFTSAQYDVVAKEALEAKGVRVFTTTGVTHVNVDDVSRILGEQQISSVLIEGGGAIHAAFLEAGLVDKVVLYIAPKLVGGAAPSFLGGAGVDLMSDAWQLERATWTPLGPDLKVTGYVTKLSE